MSKYMLSNVIDISRKQKTEIQFLCKWKNQDNGL